MCIIAIVAEDKNISDEHLTNMFKNNPDGAGIAFVDRNFGTLEIIKGIFSPKKLIAKYKYAKGNSMGDIVIHCRLATHGEINKKMCHPFFVNKDLVFAHNGIIEGIPNDSEYSDTYMFVNYILKWLPTDYCIFPPVAKLLLRGAGSSNKFAFLDNKGHAFACGDGWYLGTDGVMYSNTTYSTDKERSEGSVQCLYDLENYNDAGYSNLTAEYFNEEEEDFNFG